MGYFYTNESEIDYSFRNHSTGSYYICAFSIVCFDYLVCMYMSLQVACCSKGLVDLVACEMKEVWTKTYIIHAKCNTKIETIEIAGIFSTKM